MAKAVCDLCGKATSSPSGRCPRCRATVAAKKMIHAARHEKSEMYVSYGYARDYGVADEVARMSQDGLDE